MGAKLAAVVEASLVSFARNFCYAIVRVCLTASSPVVCRMWSCRLRWWQRLGRHPGKRASLWLPPPGSPPASAGCRSAAWLLTMWQQETLPLPCDCSTGTCYCGLEILTYLHHVTPVRFPQTVCNLSQSTIKRPMCCGHKLVTPTCQLVHNQVIVSIQQCRSW